MRVPPLDFAEDRIVGPRALSIANLDLHQIFETALQECVAFLRSHAMCGPTIRRNMSVVERACSQRRTRSAGAGKRRSSAVDIDRRARSSTSSASAALASAMCCRPSVNSATSVGASRNTVREALRTIRTYGLIERQAARRRRADRPAGRGHPEFLRRADGRVAVLVSRHPGISPHCRGRYRRPPRAARHRRRDRDAGDDQRRIWKAGRPRRRRGTTSIFTSC